MNQNFEIPTKNQSDIFNYQVSFMIVAYQSSIDTYNKIADRVSTRFNIILTIDIALAGYFIDSWLKDRLNSENASILLPIIGILISLFLFFQSAQDKYILKKERIRVNKIKRKIRNALKLENFPCLFDSLDDTDSDDSKKPKRRFIFENIFSWRSNIVSISKIPCWISGLLIILWILIFILNSKVFLI